MLKLILISMRPNQWTKNLSVFAAIIFNGRLFDPQVFYLTLKAFICFCLLSSASYIINDINDIQYDRLHPVKRFRPIASGKISIINARLVTFTLILFSLLLSLTIGPNFFFLCIGFLALHFFYSYYLKKIAILDIVAIALSFIIRALGGEVVTGYHLPVWLMFTVVFLSLFIASGKRKSELKHEGAKTRPALKSYENALLNFYSSVFAVSTLISYSLYSYLSPPPDFSHQSVKVFITENLPSLLNRKWLMLTIFPVILGLMRYSQIVFEKQQGERPEKILMTDIPLLATIASWGILIVTIIYVL